MEPMMELGAGMRRSMMPVMISRAMVKIRALKCGNGFIDEPFDSRFAVIQRA